MVTISDKDTVFIYELPFSNNTISDYY